LIEIENEQTRTLAHKLLDESPNGTIFELRPPRRSDDQNRRFHASIRDVAEQVKWTGDYLHEDEWKRLFVAAIYGQKVLPSLLAGYVVLNRHTSDMDRASMAEVQEFIYAWGSEKGVIFSYDE